jgi:methionyl-tRNA formyltransferase
MEMLGKGRHKIVCVVTQPDAPTGRGREPMPPPAKRFAVERGIPVFQPEKVSAEIDAIFSKLDARPDIIVTCAYGQILKQNVLDACRFGVINVHFSLLPAYRGACPVNFAIMNGETKTGVTIMQTALGLDTGDVLTVRECEIGARETAGELLVRLSEIGAELLAETLDEIEAGKIQPKPQDNSRATYFPMLEKSDGRVDFSKSPHEIVNFIRGVNPWPMAVAASNCGDIRIHSAHTAAGELVFDIVQAPGGRPMGFREFLNGHKNFKWSDE